MKKLHLHCKCFLHIVDTHFLSCSVQPSKELKCYHLGCFKTHRINFEISHSGIDRDPGKIPVPVKISLFAGIPVPVKIVKFTGIPTGILLSYFWKIQLNLLECSDIFYKIFYTLIEIKRDVNFSGKVATKSSIFYMTTSKN